MTSDTSGLHGSSSSSSVALQSSLVSKFRARTVSAGSTLYKLTWKQRVTPSGRLISQLQASARPIGDIACTSGPTPLTNDATGSTHCYGPRRDDGSRANYLKLPGAVKLVPWSTPKAGDSTGASIRSEGKERSMGRERLNTQVLLVPWATPAAQEAGGTPEQFLARKRKAQANGAQLGVSLTSLSLQAQLVDSGQMPVGSCAPMASIAVRNPAHSLWLMGLPTAWIRAAPRAAKSSTARATRLSHPLLPPSSPASSTPVLTLQVEWLRALGRYVRSHYGS
jgi:hypothetical protein